MVHLSQQFVTRKVKKTYVAIINGIPDESIEASVTAETAFQMGMDVDPNENTTWQLIDYALDEKHAITAWRPLQYSKSLKAKDQTLTLVELKPKTGRYHQLRRHMVSSLWLIQIIVMKKLAFLLTLAFVFSAGLGL